MKGELFAVAAVAALSGCSAMGGGRRLSRSAELPAAEGTVRFVKTGVDETFIDLRVKHLEDPNRLSAPAYTYVAWVSGTRDDPPRNVGALSLGRDCSGALRTAIPLRRFEIFVTAESTSDAAAPTGERLLWTARD